jgi:membrane protease YdiL (CAAX protease family)
MNNNTSSTEKEIFRSSVGRLLHNNWVVVTIILLVYVVLVFAERTRITALVTLWLCIFFLLQPQGKRVIGLQNPIHWIWWIIAPVTGIATVSITAVILWALVGWTESNMFYDMAHAVGETFHFVGEQAPLWSRFAIIGFVWLLLTPFLEEPLFRGFTQSVYGQKIGIWAAIVLQSVIFAWVHPLNSISWFVSIFAAGFVYGILTKYSQSIWVAVLAHATYNLGILWVSFNFVPEYIV